MNLECNLIINLNNRQLIKQCSNLQEFVCVQILIRMKTIKKVEITPVFVEFIPKELEQAKVYISEKYEVSVHLCLCRCGEKTVMPLGKNGWRLIKEENGTVSFTPSVGNFQSACKSHYIITKNIANFV
jgi:hypothetical protein